MVVCDPTDPQEIIKRLRQELNNKEELVEELQEQLFIQQQETESLRRNRDALLKASKGVTEGYNYLSEECGRLLNIKEQVIQQAKMWKMEARAHSTSLMEAYQCVSESKGSPGLWNGAQPIIAHINTHRYVAAMRQVYVKTLMDTVGQFKQEVHILKNKLQRMPLDVLDKVNAEIENTVVTPIHKGERRVK